MMLRSSALAVLSLLSVSTFAKPQTVHVCLSTFREELSTLAFLSAQDLGAFEKQGLKVEVTVKGARERKSFSLKDSSLPSMRVNDANVAQAVSKGQCDFGSSVVDYMLTADQDIVENTEPIFVSSYDKNYDTHLVTAKNSKIASLKDLKGKRVRVGQLPNALALDALLKKEGLGLKDIEQVQLVPVTEVLAQLEDGRLDAAITYVPTMPYMLASGRVRVLSQNLLGGLTGGTLPHSLILVNKSFHKKNREAVTKFLAALDSAQRNFSRNPHQIVTTLANHTADLHVAKWQIDPVVTERSDAFIGKVNLIDLTKDESARLQMAKDVKTYAQKLQEAKYLERTNDLSRWFGAPVTASAAIRTAL
jgi:ABC-type nitrate/sulfonate/bicarbonate transport system substrate-binding protein